MNPSHPLISVIMPCWRGDGPSVVARARTLLAARPDVEVIVADASGTVTDEMAQGGGFLVVRCQPGRGGQLNRGAERASGEILAFNHADTRLAPEHLESLASDWHGAVGGAFYKALRVHHPAVGWAEPFVRWITRNWGVLYGDQTVFVRRSVYSAMGGFKEIPLMEDVDFSDRLRKEGAVVLLDPPLVTSMRRFRRLGYLRNKGQNLLFVMMYRCRLVSAETLYRWYYGAKTKP